MDSDDIELHDLKDIEENLSSERGASSESGESPARPSADGFMVTSASGFMVT